MSRKKLQGENAKIVATLGPGSRSPREVRALAEAGVDVFRLNFSHGEHAAHLEAHNAVRAAPDALVVADGTSCRHQIADGAQREALHVARVLAQHLAAP